MRTVNAGLQREINERLVVEEIRQRGPISRIDIARSLGLERSTVSAIVGRLLAVGLATEISVGPSTARGGKPPVLLAINADWGWILGVDLQVDRFRTVAVDACGRILARHHGELPVEHPIDVSLRNVVADLPVADGPAWERCMGIGVGVPGVVDTQRGVIIESMAYQIADFAITDEVCSDFTVPILFENDANCGAWGELSAANAGGTYAYLLGKHHFRIPDGGLSMGIGLGIMIRGRLHHGSRFRGGEFRSPQWRVGIDGDLSNPGHLSIDNRELRDFEARPLVRRRFFRELLAGLSPVVAALDLDELVVGGDLLRYLHTDIAAVLHGELSGSVIAEFATTGGLRPASCGEDEVAYGAASMFLSRLFSVPEIQNEFGRTMPWSGNLSLADHTLADIGVS